VKLSDDTSYPTRVPLSSDLCPPTSVSPPFHPQCRIFSVERLVKRLADLSMTGQTVAADELKLAIEKVCRCQVMIADGRPSRDVGGAT